MAERRCGSVAIAGRPNVGKSTLLNRLLGLKLAITSHKPQTTRHALLGIHTSAAGQILFVDTPGLHPRGGGALNRYLNRTAQTALEQADRILLVVEALRFRREDEQSLRLMAATRTPILVAVNKIDRVSDKSALLPYLSDLAARHPFLDLIPVSATRGTQIDRLAERIIASLPLGEPLYPEDQLTDRSERFLAAELLREQITQRYAKELPYQTTVEIEHFLDQGGRYRIAARIWVEREGQKAILVGHGGRALKAAATQARLEMQKLFGCPVHLEVWVKTKKSWSSDESALARLGYGE